MLEAQYPKIPFLPVITEASKLPEYITYFFGLGIALAGTLAVISLAVAGIRLIISPGNPESEKEAKEQIKGSILGLILLAASYLIISTINPQLVTPILTDLGEVPGIFYTNGEEGKTTPAPMSESDTTNIPENFNTIVYKCAAGAYSPNLFIWKYPKKNFQDYEKATVEEIECEGTTGIEYGTSFKMAFKTPGVYYYLQSGCPKGKYMSEVNLATGNISDEFKGKIKSIKIINNPAENEYYGFVAHGDVDLMGQCELPVIERMNDCADIDIPVSSIDIFKWNKNKWADSGNGIVFYSEPFGWKTGQLGGNKSFTNDNIGTKKEIRASEISFDSYSGNLPAGYRASCSNFYNCPGAVELKGNYVLVFYSQDSVSEDVRSYCQVFYKTIFDFNLTQFPPEYRRLGPIYIIPAK